MASVSNWLSDTFSSRKAQLAGTAVITASATAAALLAYESLAREERTRSLKADIPPLPQHAIINKQTERGTSPEPTIHFDHPGVPDPPKEDARSVALAARARQGNYDEELIWEQLARNRVFLKDEGLKRVRDAFIIIVGCGGVGSHAAAALARSGVSRIRLIDFDQVTLSSLNRHAVATLADVGTPKVQCIRKRLEQITPWVQFDCRNELFSKKVALEQLATWDEKQPAFVLDAIDNIDSKVDLLHYCHQNALPVISSMGAGCKSDPTRIIVGDISASAEDPLSRSTRRRLKLLGVHTGIPVVFSTEKTSSEKAQLMPLPDEEFAKGDVKDLSVMQDFRVRILPVLGTMPAIFGLTVANHILLQLGQYPHEYLSTKFREKTYETILQNLQGHEERLTRFKGEEARGLKIPVTLDDVAFLVEEVYRGKSVVSGIPTRLVLVRWRLDDDQALDFVDTTYEGQKASRLRLENIVCMTKEEAAKHESEILKNATPPESLYSSEILYRVKSRLHELQSLLQHR
ncbi:MAG: hypothetical protein Q9162_007959 [Coniocarpon cinnabarinum]